MKTIKKIFLIVLLTLALMACKTVWPTNSAYAGTKTITFSWDQNTGDLPNLKEWRLKYSFTAGGPYALLATVPYDGTPRPEYTNPASVSIVADGEKRIVYFIATAAATSGAESGPSNEVLYTIDFSVVTVPIRLKIIIGN
jgi:hypothetical protein